jgi:hypothetical protein
MPSLAGVLQDSLCRRLTLGEQVLLTVQVQYHFAPIVPCTLTLTGSFQTGPYFKRDTLGGRRAGRFIDLPVDGRNFLHKAMAIAMFQVEDFNQRPVKMEGDEGYLLEQAVERVAYDPPGPAVSTSNTFWQLGQVTVIWLLPSSSPTLLILR